MQRLTKRNKEQSEEGRESMVGGGRQDGGAGTGSLRESKPWDGVSWPDSGAAGNTVNNNGEV